MSKLQRREFLAAASLSAAAAAALANPRAAEGGDPSFMNNVPDPLLAGEDLPTFKFELEKSAGKVDNGSEAREATVKQLPISKGIAGVSQPSGRSWTRGESGRQSSPQGVTQRRMTSSLGTCGISRAATVTCWSASAASPVTSS
jgi:hypothetical protein